MENAPTGRLGRMARLAALGLKTGAGAVLSRSDSGEAAAQKAALVLGNLRGLAAKMGQMASYVDGIVPEGKRDAFEASLKMLRAQGPRSTPESIRALVEEELGAPIDRLFATFDDEPIASASIGQVHKATLLGGGPNRERRERFGRGARGAESSEPLEREGEAVAVKVQHAGIRKAVESDLANAGILEGLAAIGGGRRFDTKMHLDVIRARFREELDYALEGSRLVSFAKLHEGDPKIRIPRFVADRSSASVLTTELVYGKSFDDAIAATEDERRAWAETLWRFVFKGNLIGGMFNADPHPGNYIFQDDGKVAFLDYGCVQIIDEVRRPFAQAIHRAALVGDEKTFFEGVSIMIDAKPGALEKLARDYTRICFEPLFASPYRITRPYAASLVDAMKDMALAARKAPKHEFFTMPGEMLFMNRLQFGFYSVLARLDVEVDYAAVERGFFT